MPSSAGPVSLEEALAAERAALRPPGNEAPLRALCLSGGGIRSATFGLGALQRMAAEGLLGHFDYLSTVSGGGYIGGWLTAWIQRAGGWDRIAPALRPEAAPPAGGTDPVEHLREYNNYLTPKLGALSADTWTVGVTVVRNILLNWLVFVPILLLALMAPRLWLAFNHLALAAPAAAIAALPWAASALYAAGLANVLRYLPGVGGVNHTTGRFLALVLAPIVLAAALASVYEWLRIVAPEPTLLFALAPCLLVWAIYGLTHARAEREGDRGRELLALLGAVLVLGLGTGAAVWLLQVQTVASTWAGRATVGVPLLLLGFSAAGCLFVGLSSHALNTQDREWLARAEAYLLQVVAVWLVACTAVLLAPGWLLGHPWQKSGLAAVGAAAAWAGSHLGFLAPISQEAATEHRFKSLAIKVAPLAFLALLALALALGTDGLLAATGTVAVPWWAHREILEQTSWAAALGWTAGFAALALFMGYFININKFSLQGMYRDRLIRAYLGASNPKANADRFTGFSTSDDMAMHELDPQLRPLQVVNMTLNLVAGERLAWQQRKAEPFTATALHCGSAGLGYRPSAHYGGEGGITLGTAVATSGAAASPNEGYHSSPLVGFLMTLFNVRLGAWLGNPGAAGRRTWTHAGPRFAAAVLAREAVGDTTGTNPHVYLSDGGHFENLGLYEMVRRRCRSIVVLDAGCDPGFAYEDLGNALRKIRIDLRVPIEFERPPQGGKRRAATARIRYSRSPQGGEDGELLYIKPVMLGNEPPDVASYHAAHPAFPHQSTGDQWFDESQTESYRMLGDFTIAELCRGLPAPTLEAWFAAVGGAAAAREATA